MKQQNRKTPLIFRIGLMLACVLILCCHMMGGLYARYATTCTSSGEARVARFSFQDDIDEKYQSIPTSFGPGESVSTTIQIENTAEVTLKYVVKVENLTKNLPIKDQIIQSGEIRSNTQSTFSWSVEWPENENSIEYMGKMDVLRIVVTVEQVD